MNRTIATAAPLSLPAPDERPGADVVIFDGHCKFCRRQISWLKWLDRRGRLAYLSLHDPEVARRWPDLTYDQLMEEMYVIEPEGRRHHGAEAFRYLSRRLPGLWPLALPMHVPLSLPLWRWLYRQVARRRYLFGRIEACDEGSCKLHGH